MTPAHGPALVAWLGVWRALRRWHRYETDGLEHLLTPGTKLVVGYHGRGVAHDMCMLSIEVYERLGYLPHGIVHAAARKLPVARSVVEQLAFVTGPDALLESAIDAGEHIFCTPGGTREACRPFWIQNQVSWGRRAGFARLAATYDLPIVPVGCSGVDWTYLGLNDGYALGKRVRIPFRLPLWFGVGFGGLFPFAPPLPVKLRQRIGAPISTTHVDPSDPVAVQELARRVAESVQSLS